VSFGSELPLRILQATKRGLQAPFQEDNLTRMTLIIRKDCALREGLCRLMSVTGLTLVDFWPVGVEN
jgi:hypothetical protein